MSPDSDTKFYRCMGSLWCSVAMVHIAGKGNIQHCFIHRGKNVTNINYLLHDILLTLFGKRIRIIRIFVIFVRYSNSCCHLPIL